MGEAALELRVAWERHIGDSSTAKAWFDSVVARHAAPERHYHDIRHVRWVVRHVLELADRLPIDDLGAVVAAAFFHDIVYDPIAGDNELASARLATEALTEIGWDVERTRRVADMIVATIDHDAERSDLDTQLLLAADLGVLAAEPVRYLDYVRAVRREYQHVSDAEWRTGRTGVLRNLADREHLFAPALQLVDWERRARANIAAERATLDGTTGG